MNAQASTPSILQRLHHGAVDWLQTWWRLAQFAVLMLSVAFTPATYGRANRPVLARHLVADTVPNLAWFGVLCALVSLVLIRIVLSTGTEITSLTRREADLAVRTLKPTSPDLISRHLTKRGMGLYATPEYLKERGTPIPGNGLAGHDIVIYQSAVAPRHREKICLEPVANARVAIEVNSGLMLLEAARKGMGVTELPCHMADGDPRLTRIWPDRVDHYDVWLVMHSDLSRSARVRAAADAIVDSFPGSQVR